MPTDSLTAALRAAHAELKRGQALALLVQEIQRHEEEGRAIPDRLLRRLSEDFGRSKKNLIDGKSDATVGRGYLESGPLFDYRLKPWKKGEPSVLGKVWAPGPTVVRRCLAFSRTFENRLSQHLDADTPQSTGVIALADYTLRWLIDTKHVLSVRPHPALVSVLSPVEHRSLGRKESDANLVRVDDDGEPVPLDSLDSTTTARRAGRGAFQFEYEGPLFLFDFQKETEAHAAQAKTGRRPLRVWFPQANVDGRGRIKGIPLYPPNTFHYEHGEFRTLGTKMLFVPLPYAFAKLVEEENVETGPTPLILTALADFGMELLVSDRRSLHLHVHEGLLPIPMAKKQS